MASIQEIESCIRRGDLQAASAGILELVRQGQSPEGRHVFFAHTLLAGSPWAEMSALLPAGTNSLVETGWLNSVMRSRPVNRDGLPIPWFTYAAIDFLEGLEKGSWKVFEWGSGNSTLWWAGKCAGVVAVEDNESWYAEVKGQLPGNARYVLATDQESYVGAIDGDGDELYDVVVIDGSHRNQCAARCVSRLSEGGVVVFDNTDCLDHDDGVSALMDAGFQRIDFWGLIPSYFYRNCTSLFFKDARLLRSAPNPARQSSILGLSCGQAIDALQGKRKP